MLENYQLPLKETTNQLLLISKDGIILDAKTNVFKNCIGKSIIDLHPFFYSLIDLLTLKENTFNFDCINLEIEGKNYTLDAILHTNIEKEHSIFVFQDLTKQYTLYQKMAQRKNVSEIKKQLLDYNNTILQEKETFKNTFIANFSHEIKMPISTINGFTRLLENTNLEQSQRYNLKVIKNTNDKLNTMISDIIDISKIETNRFSILPIRYNLIEELNTIATIYTAKSKEKGLELHYTLDPNCPKYVVGDKYRLVQILNNLVGNAIKFTQAGTVALKINCVSTNNNTAQIELSIEDTGIGIEKNQIESIFNGFYQINNNLINNNGAGLGLSITKKLIHQLGGKIQVNSEIDKGSIFKVFLDFEISQNQKEDEEITKIVKTTSKNDFKILLAEPLPINQKKLLKIISQIKNCDIVIVDNGDKVIEELYKSNFSLVILNLKLPTMDGLDTARFIRHSDYKEISKTPIIILSEKPSKKEEAYCKERRVNSYIGKPFDKSEIIRKIKYILKKKQAK